MNATDTRDYVLNGFKDLSAKLEAENAVVDVKRAAELATAARQRSVARVRAEYAELGVEPPSPLALSITARLAMGLPLPEPAMDDGWMREDVA